MNLKFVCILLIIIVTAGSALSAGFNETSASIRASAYVENHFGYEFSPNIDSPRNFTFMGRPINAVINVHGDNEIIFEVDNGTLNDFDIDLGIKTKLSKYNAVRIIIIPTEN